MTTAATRNHARQQIHSGCWPRLSCTHVEFTDWRLRVEPSARRTCLQQTYRWFACRLIRRHLGLHRGSASGLPMTIAVYICHFYTIGPDQQNHPTHQYASGWVTMLQERALSPRTLTLKTFGLTLASTAHLAVSAAQKSQACIHIQPSWSATLRSQNTFALVENEGNCVWYILQSELHAVSRCPK